MKDSDSLLTFFAGVMGNDGVLVPEHFRFEAGLQEEMTAKFEQQAKDLMPDSNDNEKPVPFKAQSTYRLERGQIFEIKNCPLPLCYSDAILKPHQQPEFALGKGRHPHIISIFAGESVKGAVTRVIFQQFRSPQLLERNRIMLFKGNVFTHVANDGLSIGHEVAAIWKNGNLYFKSFHVASRFFDLTDLQPEATLKQIGKFMKSSLFVQGEDFAKVLSIIESDSFLRRRITSILAKEILQQVKPTKTAKLAKAFNVAIPVKKLDGNKSQIELPTVKKDLKAVVKFLNEEYFHGEITKTRYETNSLRPQE